MRARGSVFARFALLAVIGALALGSTAAFAAAPEEPKTLSPEEVTNTKATLEGILNPHSEAVDNWYFEYNPGSTCTGEDKTPALAAEQVEGKPVAVEARFEFVSVSHLLQATQYAYCLVAENAAGETAVGKPAVFTTTAVQPAVSAESVSEAASTSATVSAQINGEGSPTSYRVEYGTSDIAELSTQERSIGAAEQAVGVSVQLNGLTPDTEYHFRFVARNENGASEGFGGMFVTASSTGPSALILPDERVYELVSPIGNPGDVYAPEGPYQPVGDASSQLPFRASADGSAVVYVGDPAVSGGSGSIGNGEGDEFLARRGPQGWSANDIQPPTPVSPEEHYEGFLEDLTAGVVSAVRVRLANAAPEKCRVLYAHAVEEPEYTPLFTSVGSSVSNPCGQPVYAGSSADGSHLLFQTEAALTPEAEQSSGSCASGEDWQCDLYDSAKGHLWLVNILPSGTTTPDAVFGGLSPDKERPDLSNAISADGSRIFWTDEQPGPDLGHIFLRENDIQPQSPVDGKEECTIPADACTVPVSLGAAQFWTAAPDGSYVLYTEDEKLWRFTTESGTREELVGAEAGVKGLVGSGMDGSYIYFVASGALAGNENSEHESAKARICLPISAQIGKVDEAFSEGSLDFEEWVARLEPLERENAEQQEGKIPPKTGCNLYLLHLGATEPMSFIATLAPEDNDLPGVSVSNGLHQFGDWQSDLGSRTAEVTPDGRGLVFKSTHRLTGYDNSFVSFGSERAEAEVFAYDADTKRLSCASCDPSGVRPSGKIEEATVDTGTLLPVSLFPTFMHRWISNDGSRVFFETTQPLVAQDTNGLQDVYEWEREGAKGCPGQAGGSPDDGCVFLLSGGKSTGFAYLVDADPSGDNAFFTSRAQLVPQDGDEKTDLYDARVGGGFPETLSGCTGTGCQGVPPAPPIFAIPSSVTFDGIGNFGPKAKARVKLKPKSKGCRRRFTKAHGRCAKKPKRKAKKVKKRAVNTAPSHTRTTRGRSR